MSKSQLNGFIGKEIKNNLFRKYPFGITRGNGFNDGLIACLEEDTINFSFRFLNNSLQHDNESSPNVFRLYSIVYLR